MKKQEETAQERREEMEEIVELGGTTVKKGQSSIYTLTIIGQIEGHQVLPESIKTTKYEHVLPLLASIEEDDSIDGLLLLLNTVGGDIEAGLAIAEMISGMKKPTVSLVLGGGHSIGVPLAVSASKSLIVPSASMTIHPVRISGTVVSTPATFQNLSRIQDQIVQFVTDNSGIEKKKFTQYMMAIGEIASDVGTVIYGREAVACGLIDNLGSLGDALDALHALILASPKKKNQSNGEKKKDSEINT